MLAWMITTHRASQPGNLPQTLKADFIVTSQAEWNTVFANDTAALSNKIIEVAAPITVAVAIANHDFIAAGGPVTIRSANAGSYLSHLDFNTLVRGVNCSGLNFQMVGWPAAFSELVQFNTGTYGALKFDNGTSFRHGYGPSLTNIDTAADLPEYTRVNNVQTATTTSQTFPLSWQDDEATAGYLQVFNRGVNGIRIAVGGPNVVATGSSQLIAAGSTGRVSGLDPTAATHFAILATAGTSQVNARSEIGLSYYLCNAFKSLGSTVIEDIEIRDCVFRDLLNGAKSIFQPQSVVCMDCDFDRIYADVMALPPTPGGTARILRNLVSVQFARSGIPESDNGDAGDPHGDVFQMFGSSDGTISDVIIAGTRMRARSLRAGVTNQGMFISDNDVNPSYSGIYIISNTLLGGSPAQIAVGEPGWPAEDVMIYGSTIIKYDDVASATPRIAIDAAASYAAYIGSTISGNLLRNPATISSENRVDIDTTANPAAVIPNLSQIFTATTRAQIDSALTTAAEGAGIGAVATGNAIDWNTADPEAVVLWQNVPSGVYWDALTDQDLDTQITLPLRKVLNPRAGQTVSVGTGTEWRKVDADGTTELLAWTSAPGTIEPGQFMQLRRTTSTDAFTAVTASVTINGFAQDVSITTGAAPVTTGLIVAVAGQLTPAAASFEVPVPPEAQAGDLLVFYATSASGFEVNNPTGWTTVATSNGHALRRINAWDGTTNTYTFTASGSIVASYILLVFRDYNWGAASAFGSFTANPAPPTITVPADGSLNFTLVGALNSAHDYSMPAGWTSAAFNNGARTVEAFQRNALVAAGSLVGVTATRIAGSGSGRAFQFSLSPR